MELNDYFFIDSKRSLEQNLLELPMEINNGSIFSWEFGFYTKKVYIELIKCLEKYGEKYSLNKLDDNSNNLIFTKVVDNLLDFIIKNSDTKKHFFFFLTQKEINENSYLTSFFYLNESINYNLLSNHFIKNGAWSDVERYSKTKNENLIYFALIFFRKYQKKYKLNPSYLFEIKDNDSVKFVMYKIYNLKELFEKELNDLK